MKKLLLLPLVSIFALSLISAPLTYAAQTTMEVSPRQGSFNKAFTADIIIDGHGDVFNAAEATVTLSPNLSVQDLTLGDCNFSYLSTPTTENLSFSGVILSGSSKKCTVYSMTLLPKATGKASVTLSKGTVRQYGDAAAILKSTNNASFTLTGTVKSAQTKNEEQPKANGLYTVTINVEAKENEPLIDAEVLLTSPGTKNPMQTRTSQDGKAQFTKIKEGIYQATVTKDNREVAKTIVNVKGSNANLTFGINIENQKNNPLLANTSINILGLSPMHLAGILGIGILFGASVALTITRLNGRKKKTKE